MNADNRSMCFGWVPTRSDEEVNQHSAAPNHHYVRYDRFVKQLTKKMGAIPPEQADLLHAILGLCSEAGELADPIKAHVIYGKPLDLENVIEELGDLRFYMQAIQNCLGISESDILLFNAAKLRKRYAILTYSDEAAIARADKNPNS